MHSSSLLPWNVTPNGRSSINTTRSHSVGFTSSVDLSSRRRSSGYRQRRSLMTSDLDIPIEDNELIDYSLELDGD